MWREPLHTYDEPREPGAHDDPADQRSHDRGVTAMVAATIAVVLAIAVLVLAL